MGFFRTPPKRAPFQEGWGPPGCAITARGPPRLPPRPPDLKPGQMPCPLMQAGPYPTSPHPGTDRAVSCPARQAQTAKRAQER